MKFKRGYLFLLVVFIFSLFINTNAIEVNAMNTGFSTEDLTEDQKSIFISKVNISLLTMEPAKRGILCFDVNKHGLIAIGQKNAHNKEICIYSAEGIFLYGYTFNCSQSYSVEWDDECINIYFFRSDVIMSLDPAGNILDVKKVPDTISNNTHRNNLLYSTRRIIEDTTYLIRNDMGIFNWIASSYSQVVTIDAAGVEHIIYDVGLAQFLNVIAIFIVVLMFTSLAIAIVVWQFIKQKRWV